jgi:hypothetical protein
MTNEDAQNFPQLLTWIWKCQRLQGMQAFESANLPLTSTICTRRYQGGKSHVVSMIVPRIPVYDVTSWHLITQTSDSALGRKS